MTTLVLLAMLFCHIIDDYYLQGVLAHMKQRRWWRENATDSMYENDYKMCLAEHSLSWACCIHIPLVLHIWYCDWYFEEISFLIIFVVNWLIHAIVDDLKCNKRVINLVQDQTIHFIQIIITWLLYFRIVM